MRIMWSTTELCKLAVIHGVGAFVNNYLTLLNTTRVYYTYIKHYVALQPFPRFWHGVL